MRSRLLLLAIAFLVAIPFLATRISLSQIVEGPDANHGPWEMEHSGTTAGLRGVHAAGGGVVWASGTDGTVLRSEDTGFVWQTCAVPPDGAKLDFRGVWAWDGKTAVVMSSGPGSESRLYKTTDGCMSWQLLYTNPDESGFWDAIQFQDRQTGYLLGDPVGGRFVIFETTDGGTHWQRESDADLAAPDSQAGAFAASNSALLADRGSPFMFGTSGPGGPYLFIGSTDCTMNSTDACGDKVKWERKSLPLAGQSSSSGIFSLGSVRLSKPVRQASVAVGGDLQEARWHFRNRSLYESGRDLDKRAGSPARVPLSRSLGCRVECLDCGRTQRLRHFVRLGKDLAEPRQWELERRESALGGRPRRTDRQANAGQAAATTSGNVTVTRFQVMNPANPREPLRRAYALLPASIQ